MTDETAQQRSVTRRAKFLSIGLTVCALGAWVMVVVNVVLIILWFAGLRPWSLAGFALVGVLFSYGWQQCSHALSIRKITASSDALIAGMRVREAKVQEAVTIAQSILHHAQPLNADGSIPGTPRGVRVFLADARYVAANNGGWIEGDFGSVEEAVAAATGSREAGR